jgi:predicted nucleic acid-binding protein
MMIVVDTSVWAGFFNGADASHVHRLDAILSEEQEQILLLPLILMEVLQGFRSDSGFERAKETMVDLPVHEPSLQTYIDGARLFRRLRRNGVTVRGAVDCLIAQVCIETESELLTADRDFVHIAAHTSLALASVS